MAGIYLHIPFCKQACHYCDFHFSTSLKHKDNLLEAILMEARARKDYLNGETVQTIYLGGGTPSLLNETDLQKLFDEIHILFSVSSDVEVTLEANPDDLNQEYLQMLRRTPVNRLSVGLQSFHEDDLKLMNRAHNATEALTCIKLAQDAGLPDISIDLIYGMPNSSAERWGSNLATALDLNVPHLSAYALTVEPGTALFHQVEKGLVKPASDDEAAAQFQQLRQVSREAGMEHYEISNFALPGKLSRHNTAYWQGKSYLGLGPSAHSFDGANRAWNVANNLKYIKSWQDGKGDFELEVIDRNTAYNEYVLTGLRTKWGCAKQHLETKFGAELRGYFERMAKPHLERGQLQKDDHGYQLTESGLLFADAIASDLFWVDPEV